MVSPRKSEFFAGGGGGGARSARNFRGSVFYSNFMYFLRLDHGFHVRAKLYPPGVLRACFVRFRGRSARAPHHATTASKLAHPRA